MSAFWWVRSCKKTHQTTHYCPLKPKYKHTHTQTRPDNCTFLRNLSELKKTKQNIFDNIMWNMMFAFKESEVYFKCVVSFKIDCFFFLDWGLSAPSDPSHLMLSHISSDINQQSPSIIPQKAYLQGCPKWYWKTGTEETYIKDTFITVLLPGVKDSIGLSFQNAVFLAALCVSQCWEPISVYFHFVFKAQWRESSVNNITSDQFHLVEGACALCDGRFLCAHVRERKCKEAAEQVNDGR